jgi:hypothetical protein
MSAVDDSFAAAFEALTEYAPLRWQSRLFDRMSAFWVVRGPSNDD